ncbi:3-deoxy-7-phosphoheptulonate synthase [Myceligenerans cantabricum]
MSDLTVAPELDVHLPSPGELREALPLHPAKRELVRETRNQIRAVLRGDDDRILVFAGPCSLHDRAAALEYAARLAEIAAQSADDLLIVMRAYVEKPRTRLGWTGFLNDPSLSGAPDLEAGATASRQLLLDLLDQGIPLATEVLDLALQPYLEDLISWSCIGARTVQSQPHRQAASGFDVPVGFKNGTDGSPDDAIDALVAASRPHTVTRVGADGRLVQRRTSGNRDAHLILRGGVTGPNFDALTVARAGRQCAEAGVDTGIVIDASHGNSGKCHLRQAEVIDELAARLATGENGISGLMIESFLEAGRQNLPVGPAAPGELVYGLSVTDACMGWDATVAAIEGLRTAARRRSGIPEAAAVA